MKSKLQEKLRYLLYMIPFFVALYLRITTLNPYDAFKGYFDAIVFIPCMAFVSFLFFNYQFYENVFVKCRYKSLDDSMKKHKFHNLIEGFKYGGWLSLLGLIIGIKYLTIFEILSLILMSVLIVSVVIIFDLIYTRCVLFLKNYKNAVVITFLCVFVYKFVFIWWYEIISTSLTEMNVGRNLFVVFVNIVLCFILYFADEDIFNFISIDYVKIIGVIIVNVVTHHAVVSMTMGEYSLSLNRLLMYALDDSERFLIVFYWIVPKLLLIFYLVSLFIKYYNENFILFAVRIKNRISWFVYVFKKIGLSVFMFCLSDFIYEVLRIGIDIIMLEEFFNIIVYLLLVILILFASYILSNDISIVNSVLYGYLGVLFVHCYIDSPIKGLLFVRVSIIDVLILVIGLIITTTIVILLLNNKEYYS